MSRPYSMNKRKWYLKQTKPQNKKRTSREFNRDRSKIAEPCFNRRYSIADRGYHGHDSRNSIYADYYLFMRLKRLRVFPVNYTLAKILHSSRSYVFQKEGCDGE